MIKRSLWLFGSLLIFSNISISQIANSALENSIVAFLYLSFSSCSSAPMYSSMNVFSNSLMCIINWFFYINVFI